MTISLSDAGKRFNRDWIFRHFTCQFEQGQSYAITGPNGSGKSTLLQVISGSMMISEGKMQAESREPRAGSREPGAGSREPGAGSQEPGAGSREPGAGSREIAVESLYKHVSIAAPYLELVEEMTATEFLDFHQGFKPLLAGSDTGSIIETIGLQDAANKQIRYYSSGMKQRVKLAQCIFSDTAVVLLDEPCTNLDTAGIELYHHLISQYCRDRLVIVSSNDEVEYSFCLQKINIMDYKGKKG